VDGIHLAQDMNQWRDCCEITPKLGSQINAKIFIPSWHIW